MYVLLVDNLPLIGRMIEKEVNALGLKLLSAQTTNDAMFQLLAHGSQIQCILFDWNLNGTNSVEWMRHLKSIETYSMIPVIMMTANQSKQQIVQAFAAGCEQYLVKPFSMEDLKARLAEVIEKRKRKKQIMIVDDSNVVLLMLKQMIKKQGYDICAVAKNGLEAVQMFQDSNPDLVFMDVNMPEMDGMTAVRELKVIDPAVRIILISGQMNPEREAEANALGVKAFLRKPFDEEMIYGALVDALA